MKPVELGRAESGKNITWSPVIATVKSVQPYPAELKAVPPPALDLAKPAVVPSTAAKPAVPLTAKTGTAPAPATSKLTVHKSGSEPKPPATQAREPPAATPAAFAKPTLPTAPVAVPAATASQAIATAATRDAVLPQPIKPASDFQTQFIKNLIDESLEAFRFSIHRDVQNLHVELLRQFQIQKVRTSAL